MFYSSTKVERVYSPLELQDISYHTRARTNDLNLAGGVYPQWPKWWRLAVVGVKVPACQPLARVDEVSTIKRESQRVNENEPIKHGANQPWGRIKVSPIAVPVHTWT